MKRESQLWAGIEDPRVPFFPQDFTTAPGRLSSAATTLIEKIRARFDIRVEVLDAKLLPISPLAGADFYAALVTDPGVRGQAQGVLAGARPQTIASEGATFVVQPLRAPGRGRRPVGVLSVRTDAVSDRSPMKGEVGAPEAWSDVLRTTLETDLALGEGLRDERLDARRATAALRFLGQLSLLETEAEIIRAVIHATAIWFDVDARVYRRALGGDLLLHTHLPGAPVSPEAQQLNPSLVGPERMRRIPFPELPEGLRWSNADVLLMPIAIRGQDEWVLVLAGTLPAAADSVVVGLAQTLGAQLDSRSERRLQDTREAFYRLVMQSGTKQTTATSVLRQLLEETKASAGTFTVHQGNHVELLAAFGGAHPPVVPPREALLAPDQLTYPMALGPERAAIIDLRAEGAFTLDDSRALVAGCRIIHAWLGGIEVSLGRPPVEQVVTGDFANRIAEELERAKRFDLGLSMVLIDPTSATVPQDEATLDRIAAAVRHELRGSDLLGVLGDGRIAALLVHTNAAGLTSVMSRLRRRIADLMCALGLPFPSLGQAAFSHDCRTASALVSEAQRDLAPVR